MVFVAFTSTAVASVLTFFSPTGVTVMAVMDLPIFEAVDNCHESLYYFL